MRWILSVCLLTLLAVPAYGINAVYLAQAAAGANTGVDCADAKAYTYFNSAGNWSGSPTGILIGPDTTVHICTTITDSLNGTMFTLQGSGTSGHPVTMKLELNVSLQSPGENQFINGNGQSHFVLTGTTTCGWINGARTACTEAVYNTLNGFAGQTCPGGACTNQVQTSFIGNFGAGDLTVENVTLGPNYIHGNTSDTTWGAPGPVMISFGSGAVGLTVHNVILHDGGWCMNAIVSNLLLYNFEEYYCDHGNGGGQYSDTASTLSNITIHDGYIHDPYPWDQTNNAFHHDGLHLFSYCATLVGGNNSYCPNTIITGVNIYNMRFGGNWGQNNTANIFFEGNVTNANMFNNVSMMNGLSSILANGCFNGYGSNINYFNNTCLGTSSVQNGNKFSGFNGPGIVIDNNVWADGGMISTEGPWPVGGASGCPYTLPSGAGGGTQACQNLSYTLNNNAYLAPTTFSNGFGYSNCTGASCTGNGFLNFTLTDFNTFQADAPETGGVFESSVEPIGAYLNSSTGAQLTGSPTIGAGTNLTTLCTSLAIAGNPCNKDIAGTARPSSGVWDIGAYQGSSAPSVTGTYIIIGKLTLGGPTVIH